MAQLDRYLLREVLVSFLLTTTILVVVIAFGAAVKPLAGDQLLSAGQVVKYIGLAIIPMLEPDARSLNELFAMCRPGIRPTQKERALDPKAIYQTLGLARRTRATASPRTA